MGRRGENIYKRKDGRWEGRYHKGRKLDGSIRYGYIYGKNYVEVKQQLIQYKAYYQAVRKQNGDVVLSFEEWTIYWLSEAKKKVKPSTYANYSYKMTHYIVPLLKEYSLFQLDAEILENLVAALSKQGLSDSTIRLLLQLVKQSLNCAMKRSVGLVRNPFDQFDLPKSRPTKVRSLKKKQQQSLEQVALSQPGNQGLPTILALHTGMRIGEIAALRWEDIEFDRNVIHVKQTCQRILDKSTTGTSTKLILGDTKTKSSNRVIPMTGKIKNILKRHGRKKEGAFVLSNTDCPYEPRLITYHFHKIRDQAGVQQVHFHQLRHTFATRCLEAKADIVSVSSLLGHCSSKMTLDVYMDSMLEQRIQVIRKLERSY